MPQDPFAKWSSEPPKQDPFAKWAAKPTENTEPPKIEPIVNTKQPEVKKEPSIWDRLTTPLVDIGKELTDPNHQLIKPTGEGGIHDFLAKHAAELSGAEAGVIDSLVPTSPGGIALAAAIGPVAKRVLPILGPLVNRIPGVKAIGEMASKDLFDWSGEKAGTKLAQELFDVKTGKAAETAIQKIAPPVEPTEPTSVIAKLHQALEESKPLTEAQKEIYKVERAAKFGKASKVDVTDTSSAKKFMSSLAGEHTKVVKEPLQLDQPDIDSLHGMIGEALKADVIDTPGGAQAITGLKVLLDGGVPVPSQIETLEKIFGSGIAERVKQSETMRSLLLKTVSIPKAIVSSLDLGFPFRQGINHVGQKEWWGMLRPAIEAYASENSTAKWLDAIKSSANFDLKKQAGLALGELTGPGREEHVLNSLVGNFPGVRNSNRAYTVAATKLRSDLFDTMYKDYKNIYETQIKLAKNTITNGKLGDKELLDSAELFNPDNLYRARKMADLINTSTGRGTIGRLEPIAEELNATFFAPRMMASRFKTINRTLNPMSYYNGDPVSRKYALKQLMSITGTILSTAALFKTAGGEVELDPRSSDFLKGRIGKVRFDMGGGFLQYIVPAAKILSNSAVSTNTGKEYELGSNPVVQNRFDVAETFLTNKGSPIADLIIALMKGTEASGKKINLTSPSPFENTMVKTIMPFMIQDFKELMDEDPSLIPTLIPASAMGGNIQVHQDAPTKKGRR